MTQNNHLSNIPSFIFSDKCSYIEMEMKSLCLQEGKWSKSKFKNDEEEGDEETKERRRKWNVRNTNNDRVKLQ